ncbi:hypothetical protein [Aeromicrobium sp. IC_218]|uniref:hypothetical protein n=1 Tax=Aeromicrobium sp. IC_218 TaxID=2545468 RepID=UPI00103BF054|nr:hypothetical protein [Aeromicrobium sp. IC_218]TCJ00328.1 hypothetical protein E0W78_03825 [Aeromicrobium sp. IC_218]
MQIAPDARRWLSVSAASLALEVLCRVYAPGRYGPGWTLLSLLLLALVWRRSPAARAVLFVLAMTGGLIYSVGFIDPSGSPTFSAAGLDVPYAWAFALSFLGQALPLLTPAVRDHVQKRDVAAPVPAAA